LKYKSCTDYWLDTDSLTFKGEFEEMYCEIDDPWGCQKGALSLDNRIFTEMLFDGRNFKKIWDVGCGLGGFTNCIFKRNGGGTIIACDVSSTAVKRARSLYPYIDFRCMNILTDGSDEFGYFDLIVANEILWYLLDGVKGVFTKFEKVLYKGGVLAIHQYFPSNQRYGKEIIDGLEGFEIFLKNNTAFIFENKVVSYHEEGRVLLTTLMKKTGE
jgi:SAM-dependent methyltransferase